MGFKLGTQNSSVNGRSAQGGTRAEALQRKKGWEEEEHVRALREVRDLLARGPSAMVSGEIKDEKAEAEWQEREGRLTQRETLQKFSNWICEARASRTLRGGRANCQDFGSFGVSSFRGCNESEMCKIIYDRERQRCKVTKGASVANFAPLASQGSQSKSRPSTAPRNQRTF